MEGQCPVCVPHPAPPEQPTGRAMPPRTSTSPERPPYPPPPEPLWPACGQLSAASQNRTDPRPPPRPLPSRPGRKKEELCFKNSGFFTLFIEGKFIQQSSLVSTFSPGRFVHPRTCTTTSSAWFPDDFLFPREDSGPRRRPPRTPPPSRPQPRAPLVCLLPLDLPVLGPAGDGVRLDASFVSGAFPSAQHFRTHARPSLVGTASLLRAEQYSVAGRDTHSSIPGWTCGSPLPLGRWEERRCERGVQVFECLLSALWALDLRTAKNNF